MLPAARAVLLVACAALLVACGNPERSGTTGTTPQSSDPVPSGPHLYCIANVGHTMVAYSLADRAVLPGTARLLELDPVGPWFRANAGYYISRVETSGAGANALIRFHPKTTAETARLKFPGNSNPNSLLLLPTHPDVAWVALRGSTFDNFATNGVAVVALGTMTDVAFCDLNADTATCDRLAPAGGPGLTSLLGFVWDAACGAAGCAYAVVNNFDTTGVRDGMLLVLEPDAQGVPVLREAVSLGRNPQREAVLDADGDLWVVNNGGFVHFGVGGQAGTLQVLDTANLSADPDGDGLPGDTLVIAAAGPCADPPNPDPGCDPVGIHSLDGATGWVTTYPHDVLRTVDLTGNALDPLDLAGLPRVTGPFFATTTPGPALFAALGGLGLARLGELNTATTQIVRDQNLQAGPAPLSCAEHQVP